LRRPRNWLDIEDLRAEYDFKGLAAKLYPELVYKEDIGILSESDAQPVFGLKEPMQYEWAQVFQNATALLMRQALEAIPQDTGTEALSQYREWIHQQLKSISVEGWNSANGHSLEAADADRRFGNSPPRFNQRQATL